MSATSPHSSVLIPTGMEMYSYPCIRSLGGHGVNTVVASEHDRVPHFSSRFCGERVRLDSPPSDLAGYADALLEIAARPDVRTIVPVREYDAFVFAKYREAFEREVTIVTPDLQTLENGHDRLQLAAAAEAAGVPVAETRPLSAVEEVDSAAVVKSRYNLLTGEYVDALAPDEARAVRDVEFLQPGDRPDRATLREEMGHEPIVQEFIPEAKKHLYCALWEDGEPLATYQDRSIRLDSWVGGGGVYRVSTHSPEVEEAAQRLLDHLDWNGLVCIEYIKDAKTGEWKFLEINPRIWQSLPEAVRAGADFPYYYWLCATGHPERIDGSYETGIGSHFAYGELSHLLSLRRDQSPFAERPSVPGRLLEIVGSCLRHPRFDYLRPDDPRFVLGAIRDSGSGNGTGEEGRQFTADTAGLPSVPSPDANDSEG